MRNRPDMEAMEPVDKLIETGRGKSAFELLHASGRLPSPRGAATRVIQLTRQDEVSIPELARAISGDPAFVGRVLKAANGLLNGVRRPVLSVAEALMVLGVPAVRALATGFALLSDHRKGRCQAFDYEQYWGSSVALALGMQAVVAHTRAAASDEAFSLGLLIRVGELALATVYPDQYAGLLEQHPTDSAVLLAAEKDAFAIHHGELGAEMLEHWGVPPIFSQVVRHADCPSLAGFEHGSRRGRLLESVTLARLFADFCLADDTRRIELLELMQRRGEALGILREEMLADASRMFGLWVEWMELLELEPRVSRSFPDVSLPEPTAVAAASVHPLSQSDRGRERLARAVAPDKPLVLVVDRESRRRRQVVELLQAEDCSVVESGDVGDALAFALELQPHMMVLGCADAGSEVLDLVASLRRTSAGRVMHLLLRVVERGDEALVSLLEAGGDDAVPMDAASRLLQARLRAGLREVRLQRELEHDRQELHGFAAQLAITNRRLQDMALTDPLTGFRNRRYAMDRLEQERAVADRSGRPLSCLAVDVDYLKEINDRFGHDAGDAALTHVAHTLRKALRVHDVICRIGGDEFLVICPGADLDAVLAGAERARRGVREAPLDFAGVITPLSVSIGAAEMRPDVPDSAALIKLADQGAYVSKQSGRNAIHAVQRA
ncbi:MAG: diguanylate cyclase [Pseudazoarcus pumilus]|nr:diguanylate cyclase [Pseudazoarcus pumilus]